MTVNGGCDIKIVVIFSGRRHCQKKVHSNMVRVFAMWESFVRYSELVKQGWLNTTGLNWWSIQ